jgi:hypothetical protein
VEKEKLQAAKPVSMMVNEAVLATWEACSSEPQFQEICRLAKVGLWAERHEGHIITALTSEMGRYSRGTISPFEKALDRYPGRKR